MKTTIATLLIAISLTACNNSSVVDSGPNPEYSTTPRAGYDCKYNPEKKTDWMGEYVGKTIYHPKTFSQITKTWECIAG